MIQPGKRQVPSRPVNLKIAHKGLILIAVPLLFELFFVVAMFSLLRQAQQEVKVEAHAKDVILTANQLMRHMVNAGTSAGGYALTRAPRFDRDHVVTIKEVYKCMHRLDELLANDPAQQIKLFTVKQSVDRSVDLIARLKARGDEESTIGALIGGPKAFGQVKSCVAQFNADVNALVDGEKFREKASARDRARTRQLIVEFMALAVVLNIVIVVGLAMFFSAEITDRLTVLTDNSLRLSRSQPLNPPLAGADEIAHLDRVFHAMVHGLEEADRLKQQLVAMVSHDLRTPLTSVEAILTYLEAGGMGELPEAARKSLRTAEADIMALISLINDLLDVDKLDAGKLDLFFENVILADVFERALRVVSDMAACKHISLSIPSGDETVSADGDRLAKVVAHLLSNAIKFSPENGVVTVTVTEEPEYLEIRVADEGPGVPDEHQEEIFQRFARLDVPGNDLAAATGTGVGLALCKAIVLKHGGNIGVVSQRGKGSSFWFRIPRDRGVQATLSRGISATH